MFYQYGHGVAESLPRYRIAYILKALPPSNSSSRVVQADLGERQLAARIGECRVCEQLAKINDSKGAFASLDLVKTFSFNQVTFACGDKTAAHELRTQNGG